MVQVRNMLSTKFGPASIVIQIAMVMLAILLSWSMGKDQNWDLLHYHLYLPHLWQNGRVGADFMGAGPQSYFNALPYFPLHAMVKSEWPALAIGAVLATLHSANLLLLWQLSTRHLFALHPQRAPLSLAAVVLGGLSPVFLGLLGSSFADPLLSVLVLAAVLCLFESSRTLTPEQRKRRFVMVCLGGSCAGLAAGIKPSNLIFLPACMPLLLRSTSAIRDGLRDLSLFALAALLAAASVNGWWAWMLFNEFGNPVLPLFNQIFGSPDFPAGAIVHSRFNPQTLADWLLLPFRMAFSSSWVYVENSAPDFRPALLCLTVLAVVAKWAHRFAFRQQTPAMTDQSAIALTGFVIVATFFWFATSANGRYALPLLLMVGPSVIVALGALASGRALVVLLILVCVLQMAVQVQSGNPRWGTAPWSAHWIDTTIDTRLKSTPHGFVSIGIGSNSFIAPFVHPQSGFMNLQGILPLEPDGYGDERVRRFLAEFDGKLMALMQVTDSPTEALSPPYGNPDMLALRGLLLDRTRCQRLARLDSLTNTSLYGCPVTSGGTISADYAAQRRRFTSVFDKIEKVCPSLFAPSGWPVVREGPLWSRRYVNTDITMFSRKGRVYYSMYDFGPFDVDLGSLEEWEGNGRPLDCRRPRPHYLRADPQ